jgi:hypothetical protein
MGGTAGGPGRFGKSRWDIIAYAIESTARTLRLCLILVVMVGLPALLMILAGR